METLSVEILAAVTETFIMTREALEICNILRKLIAGLVRMVAPWADPIFLSTVKYWGWRQLRRWPWPRIVLPGDRRAT